VRECEVYLSQKKPAISKHPVEGHKHLLTKRVDELRAALRQRDNLQVQAANCSATYQADGMKVKIHLSFFGRPVVVTFPDLVACDAQAGTPLPDVLQALLLYYLTTADGTPLEGRWIAFADLPDGRFYSQAFQGYTGHELVRCFGNDIEAFTLAAKELGGVSIAYGDAGFVFYALPRVILAVVAWRGDEDFSPNYQILFDASANHYLPTDVCAVLGSMLTRKLLSA